MNRTDIEDLARRIQAYLSSHRHAADSAEGIAKWWLAEESQCPTSGEVELALKILMRQGVVRETTNVDGTIIYERAEGCDPSAFPPSGS